MDMLKKFKVGDKVIFINKSSGNSVNYFCDREGIPKELIIHGYDTIGKQYLKPTIPEVVHIFGEYIIVRFPTDNERGYTQLGFKEHQLELYQQPKEYKIFNIGDRVRYLSNLTGTIGCIHNGIAYMSSCINDDGHVFGVYDGSKCSEHGNFMGYSIELIKDNYKNNEPSNSSQNKIGKIMSNIREFAKNVLLSREEKLLRKHGIKDYQGEFTSDARELIMQKLMLDNEKYLVELAEKQEEEEKDNK